MDDKGGDNGPATTDDIGNSIGLSFPPRFGPNQEVEGPNRAETIVPCSLPEGSRDQFRMKSSNSGPVLVAENEDSGNSIGITEHNESDDACKAWQSGNSSSVCPRIPSGFELAQVIVEASKEVCLVPCSIPEDDNEAIASDGEDIDQNEYDEEIRSWNLGKVMGLDFNTATGSSQAIMVDRVYRKNAQKRSKSRHWRKKKKVAEILSEFSHSD